MYSIESRAQEPSCLCLDPDFNVVIDPGTFPNGATLTQLQGAFPFFQGNSMTNTCLSIQGRLIIDKNFTIEEGEVIMGPGSEVLLLGNVSLTFRDVNENGGVHGCTALWRGIRPRDNNGIVRINFFNSIVQDARHAIRSNKQSIITAESTEFRNNHIGILLPNLGGGPPSPFNWSTTALRGNLFWTNGQYLPAFPNMHLDPIPVPTTVQNESLPGIGIFVHNMSLGVTIGNVNDEPNTFEGLKVGIYGIESQMTIRNNIFLNIGSAQSGFFYEHTDQAIHTERGSVRNTVVEECTFENCQVGIYARDAHLFVRKNEFDACVFGVSVRHIPALLPKIVEVNEENIFLGERFFVMFGTGAAESIDVSDNIITLSAIQNSLGAAGINIGGHPTTVNTVQGFTITDNKIVIPANIDVGTHSASGIFLSNTAGAEVSNNPVEVGKGSGIVIALSANAVISENTITIVGSNPLIGGLIVADSPNSAVHCNYVEGRSTGLAFQGICDCIVDQTGVFHCTTISGNEMKGDGGNWLVLSNAITSPQIWQGNEWTSVPVGNPSFSYIAVYYGNINFSPFSRFTTHTDALPYHPQYVLVNDIFQDPTVWLVDEESQDFYECAPMAPEEGDPDDAISIFETYAEGGFELAGYGKGAQWMAERHLYRNLKTAPALLSDTILPQFYSDAASGPIGAFYDIEQGIGTLGQIPDSVKTLLETLYEDEQTYTEAWEDVDLLIANADSLELPALEQERQDIEDDLEAVASGIAQILQDMEADRLAHIQDLQTDNAAITPANNPGHYLKSVNEIYLVHAADHSEWTTAERLTLDSIALLCPSEGGDAVYIARAMLGQLHGDDCMELPAAFQAPVPPMHATLEEPLAGIYPNPGSNEFFLNVPITQSGQAELRFYSLTGKQVLRVTMSAGERSQINLSSLATGLYLYDVWGDGRRLITGKLSKINN